MKDHDRLSLLKNYSIPSDLEESQKASPLVTVVFVTDGELKDVQRIIESELSEAPRKAYLVQAGFDVTFDRCRIEQLRAALSRPIYECRRSIQLQPGAIYLIPADRSAVDLSGNWVRISRTSAPADAATFFSKLPTSDEYCTALMASATAAVTTRKLGVSPQCDAEAWGLAAKATTGNSTNLPPAASESQLTETEWHRIEVQFKERLGLGFEIFLRDRLLTAVRRRMRITRVDSSADYCAQLERDAREAAELAATLTRTGRGLLHNPDQIDNLMSALIPLASSKRGGETLRVWLIGGGRPADAYTLAMLCLEALAATGEHSDLEIFASELDSTSLAAAVDGRFSERAILDVPPELIQRYFTRSGSEYKIADHVAQHIQFSIYRPLIDAPPRTTFDLIHCQFQLICLTEKARDAFWPVLENHLNSYGLISSASKTTPAPTRFYRVNNGAPSFYRRRAPALEALTSKPSKDLSIDLIEDANLSSSPEWQLVPTNKSAFIGVCEQDRAYGRGEAYDKHPEMIWLSELGTAAAIIDNIGQILAVNATWRLLIPPNCTENTAAHRGNFLQACLDETLRAPAFGKLYHGLQAVLAGHRPDFTVSCPYLEGNTVQWYRITITPIRHQMARRWLVMAIPAPQPGSVDDLLVPAITLDRNNDGLFIVDIAAPAQPIIFANRMCASLLGRETPFIGISIREIFPSLPQLSGFSLRSDESTLVTQELAASGAEQLELSLSVITTADGAKTHLAVSFRPWPESNGRTTSERGRKRRDRNALTLAGIGMLELDLACGQISCSDVHHELLGWAASDTPRRYDDFIAAIHPEDRARVEHTFALSASRQIPIDIEYRIIRPDRTIHWLRSRGASARAGDHAARKLICLSEEITEKKASEAFSHFAAYHDSLTHLPNRVLLTGRFDQAVTQARRNGQSLGVAFLDLDKFKNINDIFGHHIGDELLKSVAKRLLSTVRATDTVCRYSGDEFVVLITGIKSADEVHHVIEKIRCSLQDAFFVEGHALNITSSIGVAMFPNDAETLEHLIRSADAAMYQSKSCGRNTISFFSDIFDDERRRYGETSRLLNDALRQQTLELYYQPQIDFQTGALIGIEALARWHHPELGLTLPATFIPVAEESDLIFRIGEWALTQACTQNRAWQDAGLCNVPISVNLSAGEIRHRGLPQRVAAALALSGLAPEHLELELAERAVAADIDSTSRVINELRQMRLRVSIDNFGAGHAGVACLRRFPFDRLKIDRGFISSIPQDPHATTIVKAMINMAQGLGLPIVAEGVESEPQASFLKAEGCSAYQGYLFSPPVPAAAFEDVVRRYLRRSTT